MLGVLLQKLEACRLYIDCKLAAWLRTMLGTISAFFVSTLKKLFTTLFNVYLNVYEAFFCFKLF